MALKRLEKSDPVSIVLALHAIGLLWTKSVSNSLPVALLIITLLATRLFIGVMAQTRFHREPLLLVQGLMTLAMVGTMMTADGGTDSRFFLWILLVLSWQSLNFSIREFRILVYFAAATYVAVAALHGFTGTEIARFGLLVGFIFVVMAGRVILKGYEAKIGHLEQMVAAVVSLSTSGVALYDGDRHTVIFSNESGRDLGLATFDNMARLIPDLPVRAKAIGNGNGNGNGYSDGNGIGMRIDTLASLVEGAGSLPYEPRMFRLVGDRQHKVRVGIQALTLEGAEAAILVYGEAVTIELP